MTDNNHSHIYKYDNAMLLGIILVVITGFADGFTVRSDVFRSWFVFSYSFHAPLFVFLSGLFQKEYSGGSRPDIQKISYFLLLGMLLKLIIFFIRIFSGNDMRLDLLGSQSVEWFFFIVPMYMVTLYLFRKVNRWILLAGSVILGTAAGFLPLGDTLYLMRYMVFMPFFVAGYILTPAKVRRFSHKSIVTVSGVAVLVAYFVVCFQLRDSVYPLRALFTGRNPYSVIQIPGCTFYHRLLCYAISALLILAVLACMPNRKCPVLTNMGRNAIGVYFWYYPIVLLLVHFDVMKQFIPLGDPLWKYVVLVCAVALALLLSLGVFSYPLRKLEELINKIPSKVCLIADAAALVIAIVLQFTVL